MSNGTPFHIITRMESALALADECLRQMELCCKLHKKLTKLNKCERKGDSTRVMLILARYGSKSKFLERIANATNEFDKKLESLETHVKGMRKILEAKSCQCPKCYGRGSLSKWEYVRERGSVQPILRSQPCDNCNGTGELIIPTAAEPYLYLFLRMVNKIIQSQRRFQNTLDIFNLKTKDAEVVKEAVISKPIEKPLPPVEREPVGTYVSRRGKVISIYKEGQRYRIGKSNSVNESLVKKVDEYLRKSGKFLSNSEIEEKLEKHYTYEALNIHIWNALRVLVGLGKVKRYGSGKNVLYKTTYSPSKRIEA